MHQNKHSGLGAVVYGVKNESEKIDVDSLERFKNNNLGFRHVSFKFCTKEWIINAIRINYQSEKQFWFEVLKGEKVEDQVEYEGEKSTVKQVLQMQEVNQGRFFTGIEKGVGNKKIMC